MMKNLLGGAKEEEREKERGGRGVCRGKVGFPDNNKKTKNNNNQDRMNTGFFLQKIHLEVRLPKKPIKG